MNKLIVAILVIGAVSAASVQIQDMTMTPTVDLWQQDQNVVAIEEQEQAGPLFVSGFFEYVPIAVSPQLPAVQDLSGMSGKILALQVTEVDVAKESKQHVSQKHTQQKTQKKSNFRSKASQFDEISQKKEDQLLNKVVNEQKEQFTSFLQVTSTFSDPNDLMLLNPQNTDEEVHQEQTVSDSDQMVNQFDQMNDQGVTNQNNFDTEVVSLQGTDAAMVQQEAYGNVDNNFESSSYETSASTESAGEEQANMANEGIESYDTKAMNVDESSAMNVDESPAMNVDESPAMNVDESSAMNVDESPAMNVDESQTMETSDLVPSIEQESYIADQSPQMDAIDATIDQSPAMQSYDPEQVQYEEYETFGTTDTQAQEAGTSQIHYEDGLYDNESQNEMQDHMIKAETPMNEAEDNMDEIRFGDQVDLEAMENPQTDPEAAYSFLQISTEIYDLH